MAGYGKLVKRDAFYVINIVVWKMSQRTSLETSIPKRWHLEWVSSSQSFSLGLGSVN